VFDAMTRPKLISIVITNFNYERFLPDAIDSALRQTYSPLEVIVVDDGSTDGSREIIAQYGKQIRPVLRENGGNAAAYNSGFAASRGDIVLFLDSDDALYHDAARLLAASWTPDTCKAQFYLDVVDAEGRALGPRAPNVPFTERPVLPLLRTYGYYPSPPASGNAYSRAVLERIMPVAEGTWRMGIDGLLNAVVALHGRVTSIHRSLGIWRHHDRNHSEASGAELWKIRRDLLNEVNREAALKQYAAALGRPIRHELSLRIPGHCKGRLLSLKLAPELHPFADDRIWRLVLAGIVASWRFPHHSFMKRLSAVFIFPLLAVLPNLWVAQQLDPIIVAHRRYRWLRDQFLPRARRAANGPDEDPGWLNPPSEQR
jgi:glycosyltransferase involved in cell wall biosynthesis